MTTEKALEKNKSNWQRQKARLADPGPDGQKARASYAARQAAYQRRHRERILERERLYRGCPVPTRPAPEACEACGGPPGKLRFNLDHCHLTGAFRGWLCSKCNAAIGLLGDNAEGVRSALNYLLRVQIVSPAT